MGHKRRPARPRVSINRRSFLKSTAAGIAAIAAPLLPRGGAIASAANPATAFLHGVASGDPLQDRVILWTRLTPADGTPAGASLPLNCLVATDPAMSTVIQNIPALADPMRDYTVKLDVAGLQAAQTYYYQFVHTPPGSAESIRSPIGRTRTLPVGEVDRMRIGVAVCASLAHGYFNAYQRLADRIDLDFVLHLGDYIYEYADGAFGSARGYEPAHEILSLADYRTRHAQYKREPELQAMHRQHPIIAIWDDHEFANNAWQGGAENHQPATEGDWGTRVANALQAYYEWMPTRVPDPNDLRVNNRRFSLGHLADLYLLEERVGARAEQLPLTVPLVPSAGLGVFRETGAFLDPSRQLLGQTQEHWLFAGLRSAPQKWKLIGQGVMMAQLQLLGLPNASTLSEYINVDQWDGYDPVRQRLFAVLAGDDTNAPVNDVVVLTGDIHSSWAADLTPDPNKLLGSKFGGYDALTGKGSLAVEFVSTSVTSPGLDKLKPLVPVLRTNNPHFKYINLDRRGYMVLDVTPERVNNEWWFVDTIDQRSSGERFAVALQTVKGRNHLTRGIQTAAKPNAPAPAP